MIRQASVRDAETIARIHVRTWQHAYREILPSRFLARLSVPGRTEFWQQNLSANPGAVLVWVGEAGISGWINFGPCRDPGDERDGEVYAVYVNPDSWGGGIGRALMAQAGRILAGRGISIIHLWVLELNLRTIRFYKSLGYADDSRRKSFTIDGRDFVEIRMTRQISEKVRHGNASG